MNKSIIKSNTGGVGPLPVLDNTLVNALPITSVSFDTKGLKDVSVLLTFTAQINVPAAAAVNLVFIVKKYVDKGCEQSIGGSYVFTQGALAGATDIEAESFSFQLSDCDIDPGKYTYSVQLAPSSIATVAGVTITNATLTLLATGREK